MPNYGQINGTFGCILFELCNLKWSHNHVSKIEGLKSDPSHPESDLQQRTSQIPRITESLQYTDFSQHRPSLFTDEKTEDGRELRFA